MQRRLLSELTAGHTASVCGWVVSTEGDGRITVADRSGRLEVETSDVSTAEAFAPGQALRLVGRVHKEQPGLFEATTIKFFGDGPEPTQERSETGVLDARKGAGSQSVAVIRSRLLQVLHDEVRDEDGVEINTPNIVGVTMEGDSEPAGSDMFEINYFGEDAYLAQSPQIFKQIAAITGLERVYEIGRFYRAESSPQHLAEGLSLDYEAAFQTMPDVMDVCERLVARAYEDVSHTCRDELGRLDADLDHSVFERPFPRLTYAEAIDRINELADEDDHLQYGDDLSTTGEQLLGADISNCYFVTEWPGAVKSFYIMGNKNETSKSFDLMHPRIELASGGQREHRYEQIVDGLDRQGIDRNEMEAYLRFFRGSTPPHAGFGLGLDRLLMVIAGLDDVTETVSFPRTTERLIP